MLLALGPLMFGMLLRLVINYKLGGCNFIILIWDK